MVRDHLVRLFEIALLTARFSGRLVCPFNRHHVTRERRSWKNFKFDTFRADLQLSAICDPSVYNTAGVADCAESSNKLVQLYNETITALLNLHSSVVSRTARLRPRTDPWFDNHCREAKKRARSLERRYKRHGSDCIRGKWTNALRD